MANRPDELPNKPDRDRVGKDRSGGDHTLGQQQGDLPDAAVRTPPGDRSGIGQPGRPDPERPLNEGVDKKRPDQA